MGRSPVAGTVNKKIGGRQIARNLGSVKNRRAFIEQFIYASGKKKGVEVTE
jgi:hypothetical protein